MSRPLFGQRHTLQRMGHLHRWRDPHHCRPLTRGECCARFGSVITAEANAAYAGACQQNNNTAELSGIAEPLQFLMPLKFVPHDSRVCIFFDSQHAADVCFGSLRTGTDDRLTGFSWHLLLQVQINVSLTLRHIYSYEGNMDSECADHAAAFGALGLLSNHNFIERRLVLHILFFYFLLLFCECSILTTFVGSCHFSLLSRPATHFLTWRRDGGSGGARFGLLTPPTVRPL